MKKYLLFFTFCSVYFHSSAQVVFQFAAEIYGRNVDGLGMVQIQNMYNQPVQGRIFMVVSENSNHTNIVQVSSPALTLNPGLSSFPKPTFLNSSFNFYSNPWGSLANQTRVFPPGDYNFCFRFVPIDKTNEEWENCFDGSVQPLLPINLIIPANGDSICLKRPLLSWQPPMPYSSAMKFRLLLVEKNSDQNIESITTQNPVLFLDNISGNAINYPTIKPELKEGKTYCWQVIAYEQGIIISKSEIWEFTVQCKEESPADQKDSYRELKYLVNGNYYLANGFLKFSLHNNYNVTKLQYEIIDISTNQPVKNVPVVKIQQGLNKVDIDLSDMELTTGNHYILRVYPFNEQPIEVRFIYSK